MSAKLLEGKPIGQKIKEEIKQAIESGDIKPVLASIQVGENAGAAAYARSQAKTAEGLGIAYQLHKLDEAIKEEALIDFIKKLNLDVAVNGIIVQMPLPKHIDYKKISQFIDPIKDVEGMHPANIGKLLFGQADILPCTPASVMELIKASGVDLNGKEVVIVGHSEIVGKPLSLMLLEQFATVTVCHIGTSKAGKLEEHIKRAQVLIVAVGKAGLVKKDWIKHGAIVIDVGINRIDGKIVGDVEPEAKDIASFIAPVPGGVGPLTVTMLMKNTLEAARLQRG